MTLKHVLKGLKSGSNWYNTKSVIWSITIRTFWRHKHDQPVMVQNGDLVHRLKHIAILDVENEFDVDWGVKYF